MIVIGDVTGKGVPAALVMAKTQTLLAFATQYGADGHALSPGEVLTRVNELSYQAIPRNMFITCQIAEIDLKSGQITFANAGHNLPFLCRREGIVELRAVGMPLGMMPDMKYDEKETRLDRGESLFLYSDGLVEAHNHQKEMYGTPRLQSHLGKRPGGARFNKPPLRRSGGIYRSRVGTGRRFDLPGARATALENGLQVIPLKHRRSFATGSWCSLT